MMNTAEQSQTQREELFIALYKKVFPLVCRYVKRRGGTLDEAKDIFQDSLIIYYEKVISNSGSVKSNEKGYILGIAKLLWIKKYNEGGKSIRMNEGTDFNLPEEKYSQASDEKIMQFLSAAGQKCMELLKSFYYDKFSLSEIALRYGYSGIRSATVQKYKCLEKVRDTIKEKSLHYEDFIE